MLPVSMAASVLAGIVYFFVGTRLNQRHVSPDARAAKVGFTLWWYALGATSLSSAALTALYLADALPIWLFQAYTQVALLLIIGALACLLYYLIFVYTGSPRAWVVPVLYAVAMLVLIEALLAMVGTPDRLVDDGWRLQADPEPEFDPRLGPVFAILFLGPQVAAGIAYALLYRRAGDATARFRVALVSSSIIVWFSASILASAFSASEDPAWQVGSQVLSLAASITILLAYLPPKSWQRRWGLRSIRDEATPEPVPSG